MKTFLARADLGSPKERLHLLFFALQDFWGFDHSGISTPVWEQLQFSVSNSIHYLDEIMKRRSTYFCDSFFLVAPLLISCPDLNFPSSLHPTIGFSLKSRAEILLLLRQLLIFSLSNYAFKKNQGWSV